MDRTGPLLVTVGKWGTPLFFWFLFLANRISRKMWTLLQDYNHSWRSVAKPFVLTYHPWHKASSSHKIVLLVRTAIVMIWHSRVFWWDFGCQQNLDKAVPFSDLRLYVPISSNNWYKIRHCFQLRSWIEILDLSAIHARKICQSKPASCNRLRDVHFS